jgi:hypothetical protein
LLNKVPQTGYHLILAHLLHNPTYRDFYLQVEGYKILDNGAAEGSLVSDEELMAWAVRMRVDEVVIPDYAGDCEGTIGKARQWARYAEAYPQFKYGAVAQGESLDERYKAMAAFAYMDHVSVLHLPRNMAARHRWDRALAAEAVTEGLDLGAAFEAIHCLGMHSWTREPAVLQDIPLVRGIDSAAPIKMGLQCKSIRDDYTATPHDNTYFERDANARQLGYIQLNIGIFLNWAEAPISRLRDMSSE